MNHRAPLHLARAFFFAAHIAMAAIFMPVRSLSQTARETSRIKKPLIYQVGHVVHINADAPRPLLRALEALQEKYGWIVDYEDPQYLGDFDPATNAQSSPRRRQPKTDNSRGNFSVEFSSGSAPDAVPDENSVLKIVVDAYNQSDAEGQFELRQEEAGRFDVVGIGVHGENGELLRQHPALDQLITVGVKSRTADENRCPHLREGQTAD